MSKNRLGLRRSSGSPKSPRVGGLAAGRGGGLAPDMHLRRPYLPESPQEQTMDSDSPRLQGLEKGH